MTFVRRLTVAVPAAVLAALFLAAPAFGHVSLSAPGAVQGGEAVLELTVPTESETLSTIGLRLAFPLDTPIAEARVEPKPGWTVTVKTTTLRTPIQTDDGPVREAVREIDWAATGRAAAIGPGEFGTFRVDAGPLPKVAELVLKAIQVYSDHSEVAWIEQSAGGGAEPEHPAPSVALAPAGATPAAPTASAGATGRSAGGSSRLAAGALAVGIVALVLAAGAALLALRRRPSA